MKSSVMSFYQFWRKFITGDDQTLAIIILWSMAATYSLAQVYVASWFVIPITIALLLFRSLQGQLRAAGNVQPAVTFKRPAFVTWLFMTVLVVVVYAIFYVVHNGLTFYMENLILPSVLLLDITTAIGLLLTLIPKSYVFLSSLLGICVTYLLIHRGLAKVLMTASKITNESLVLTWLVVVASVMVVAAVGGLVLRKH